MAGTFFTLRMLAVLDTSHFSAGMRMMAGQATKTGTVLNASIGAGAIAVAAGMFKAGQAAASWEDSYAGVKRTIDTTGMSVGEQAEMFDALEMSLRNIAKTTPIAHDEIASMAQTAGALGVETESIATFVKVAGTISRLSDDLTADDVAYAMGKVRTVFQMGTEDFERFGSAVVKLGVSGASTEGEILSMAQYAAGAIALLGGGINDVLAYSAAFANVGVKAEAGGSAIQKMFLNAGLAVSTGDKKLTAFAKTAAMTREEFAAMFKDDPARAIERVVVGLSMLPDPLAGLREIGINQARWTRGWASVIKAVRDGDDIVGDLTDTMDMASEASKDGTFMDEMAEVRWDTFSKKLDTLGNKFGDLAITVGNTLLPIGTAFVEFLGPLVDGFNSLLQAIPAVTAVLGPLLAILSSIIAIRFGTRLLTMLLPMGPIGAILANSWTGIIDAGVLSPIITRLGAGKTRIAAAILNALAGPTAAAAAAAGGESMAGLIAGSLALHLRNNWKRVGIGAMLFAGGQMVKSADLGSEYVEQVGGGLMTIAAGFAMGGPIGAAAGAVLAGAMALMDFNNSVQAATEKLGAQAEDWMTNASTEELQQSLDRLQSLDFEGAAEHIYNASDLTKGTIFSGLFGSVAETNERTISQIEEEIANRAKGMGRNIGEGIAAGESDIEKAIREMLAEGTEDAPEEAAKAFENVRTVIQDAWATAMDKIKPPKNMSGAERIKQMQKSMRQAWREMGKSIKADDPVNAAMWHQRAKDMRAAMSAMRNRSGGVLKSAEERWKLHRQRIKTKADGVGKDAKNMGKAVDEGATSAETAVGSSMTLIEATLAAVDFTNSGIHMMQTLADGITAGLGPVREAAAAAAAEVAKPLKFSRPPRHGPLSSIRSWGPHMINEWLKPMNSRMGQVRGMGYRLGAAVTPMPRYSPAYGGGMGGGGGKTVERHYHIGVLVADQAGLDELDRRMSKRKRLRGRHRRMNNNTPSG